MSNTIQKALLVEQDSYGTYSNILHVLQKGKKCIGKKFNLVTDAKMVIYADKHSTGFSAIYIWALNFLTRIISL